MDKIIKSLFNVLRHIVFYVAFAWWILLLLIDFQESYYGEVIRHEERILVTEVVSFDQGFRYRSISFYADDLMCLSYDSHVVSELYPYLGKTVMCRFVIKEFEKKGSYIEEIEVLEVLEERKEIL